MSIGIESKVHAFRFQCTRCGHCCTLLPGGVPLYYSDVVRIAQYLKLSMCIFLKRYCVLKRHRMVTEGNPLEIPMIHLKTQGQTCVFYKDGCTINDVKPYQCKAAPFIAAIYDNDEVMDFFKVQCEGFNHGLMHNRKQILQNLKREAKLEEKEWRAFQSGKYEELMEPVQRRKNNGPKS